MHRNVTKRKWTNMSDEEVIRRRLLIDGDGTGEDRRLNNLLKYIVKWASTNEFTTSECEITYDRLLSHLTHCEVAAKRSLLLHNTTVKQLTKYQLLQQKLDLTINDARDSIESSKYNLENAQILKQNRMQYDLLGKNIRHHTARSQTQRKLLSLQAELNDLKDESRYIDYKLESRRKQFYVLLSCANQLKSMLDESIYDESMNTSLDDITNSPGPEPVSE